MNAPIEFERKFLLKASALPGLFLVAHSAEEIRQGYFMEDDERCVRVRRHGQIWLLTFKSKTAEVGKVVEIEMPIPDAEAQALMRQCRSGVHKRRHLVKLGEFLWEIDEFLDHNAGLVLAEVELSDDAQSARLSAALPAFVDREVTGEPEYFNTWLASHTLPRR